MRALPTQRAREMHPALYQEADTHRAVSFNIRKYALMATEDADRFVGAIGGDWH